MNRLVRRRSWKTWAQPTAILKQAGLEAVWIDCPLREAEFENYPACQSPMGPADFSLRVLRAREADRFAAHHEALGEALECRRDEVGCSAYVFYRDVLRLAKDSDVAESQILGHALAHEIGHLLMGPKHSATGIMRAQWNPQDLQTIARACLFFTEQQSTALRDEVAARGANRQDHLAKAR